MKVMARLSFLLVALWVGVTMAVDLQKRIIGGTPCEPTERLYHVQLMARGDGKVGRCGGSLISDEWILTAAHCYVPGRTLTAVLGVHPGDTKEEVTLIAPPEIFTDKDGNNNDRVHEIMLLRLPKPVRIQPISLPDCGKRPKIGDKVQVAGHGATVPGDHGEKKHERSTTLQCVDIDVVDCQRFRQISSSFLLYQHWFCGQTPGVDTCPGDSGGGVVFNNMIYGVHSFTGDPYKACNEAAGFMDVCEYEEWIKKLLGSQRNV